MNEPPSPPPQREPINKGRFMPFDASPKPGETRLAQAISRELRGLHVGHNIAAVQVVNSLHVQERMKAAEPKARMFSRPVAKASRATSVPARASHASPGKK
jgi:hypothetical protein